MSIESVTITDEQYGLSEGVYRGTRTYQVSVTDQNDEVEDSLSADDGSTSIPSVGDAWSGTSSADVIGKTVKWINQTTHEVTVEYSSKEEDANQWLENPLNRPTQYNWGGSNLTEPYFRDADDDPVTNSAGEDFQDLPQREIARGTLTVTRNESSFDDVAMEGFRNTLNSATVTIDGNSYAAGTLRMVDVSAQGPQVENSVTFYTVTYTIAKNINTHDLILEDRGLNELATGELTPILDANGDPVKMPYPLDGSGAAKAAPTDAPATITFKPYDRVSWSTLSL